MKGIPINEDIDTVIQKRTARGRQSTQSLSDNELINSALRFDGN